MNRNPNVRRTAIVIGLLAIVIVIGGVSTSLALELELSRVLQLKVQEKDVRGERLLEISGLCGHSAYKVKKVTVEKTPTSRNITVQITFCLFAKKGATGNFVAKVPLDDRVQDVTFGKKLEKIWPLTENGNKRSPAVTK